MDIVLDIGDQYEYDYDLDYGPLHPNMNQNRYLTNKNRKKTLLKSIYPRKEKNLQNEKFQSQKKSTIEKKVSID